MWITRQKTRLQELYREFPRPFWTLTGVTFIDQVGGALLYPFFALYFTSRFGVGMTETKPEAGEGEAEESVASSFGGYGTVLRDRMFVLFLGAGMLVSLIGMNLFTTLGYSIGYPGCWDWSPRQLISACTRGLGMSRRWRL